MKDNQIEQNSITIDATGPFTFGIGIDGELIIGYCLKGTGDLIKLHLVIPASDVRTLVQGLAMSKDIRELLEKLPPTNMRH